MLDKSKIRIRTLDASEIEIRVQSVSAKGTAAKIHNQDKVSIPKYGLKTKYINTATPHANIEKINCLNDNPKYTLSE